MVQGLFQVKGGDIGGAEGAQAPPVFAVTP